MIIINNILLLVGILADFAKEIQGKAIDILFQPELNSWNGNNYLQFKLNDLRLNNQDITYLEIFVI